MSEYTEQAEAFLKRHGLKFKAVYLEHGPHFPEDKESRDIWRLSIHRGRRSFSVRFGNSLAASDHGNTPPTAYDLLTCLTKYDPGTLDEFCREFGEDRYSERTYKAVKREWLKVSRFFTAAELEELAEIN